MAAGGDGGYGVLSGGVKSLREGEIEGWGVLRCNGWVK